MKHLSRLIICCICFIFTISNNVNASTIEVNNSEKLDTIQSDYAAIVALEPEIMAWLTNLVMDTEGVELSKDFKVDLSKVQRVYVDSDIFSLNTANETAIREKLQESTYMWILPVAIGNNIYQVNISKGLPLNESIADILDEDQIREIKENEGKWFVSGIDLIHDQTIDIEQYVTNELESISYNFQNATMVICGGLKNIHYPAAIIMKDNKADLLIPLYELTVKGTDEQIKQIKPKSAEMQNEIYLYEEIKSVINRMPDADNSLSGNGAYVDLAYMASKNNFSGIVLGSSILGVSCFLGAIYFVTKARKQKRIKASR